MRGRKPIHPKRHAMRNKNHRLPIYCNARISSISLSISNFHPLHLVSANLLARSGRPNLSFPFTQHRVWRARCNNARTLAVFIPAGGMVDLAINVDGIHPDEVISIIVPFHICVECLLADRARSMAQAVICRNADIFVFGLLLRCNGGFWTISSLLWGRFVDFTIVDPFLRNLLAILSHIKFKVLHTFSLIYQLRWMPRFAASGSLTLKCQSMWRAFFSLPWGVASNRRPQVAHIFG